MKVAVEPLIPGLFPEVVCVKACCLTLAFYPQTSAGAVHGGSSRACRCPHRPPTHAKPAEDPTGGLPRLPPHVPAAFGPPGGGSSPMASPATDAGQSHQHHSASLSAADCASREAQTWIEAVTGRCFGDKDFRGGLENGILLCELLSSIKPGLVKKINRLPTPIAGLDNLSVFLRGCEELGLKGSQLFDPGDLQDTSTRPAAKGSDCSRRLKNVLITIYWLGRAANSCTSYNGPTLDLKEFEALLSQMRKEAEEAESPKRCIRDSGYVDCWDSERSDSLSPPRRGREDSFDSLDSLGSRSQQTPSPDVLVARGNSDGRGSDSESDGPPHRKLPDVHKDDMLARRTSVSEPRTVVPFNQYLPNRANQGAYLPTPLRKRRGDKEEGAGRKSWSTATSPVGGDRPSSPNEVPSSLVPLEKPRSPPPPSPLEPHTQIQQNKSKKEPDGGERTTSFPCIQTSSAGMRRSSEPPPCILPPPPPDPPREALTHLTVTSEQSIPARWCSEELFHHPAALPGKHRAKAAGSQGPNGEPGSLKQTPVCSDFIATETGSTPEADTDSQRGLRKRGNPKKDGRPPANVSDDPQSVSMIDMRGEEEALLQPHSQVRHELMHNQYNKMKEEENHWQDDLARWKSRRRSISQDLIKKEEERKMMERLMSGDGCLSHRRRSIKTYREIVEDKERREEELRLAYRGARTPQEAGAILQGYAQRFSISEAVLERLQLPPPPRAPPPGSLPGSPYSLSSSPTTPDPFDGDPDGPLRFLRQQSAPAPRFTSTLEAQVQEFPRDPPAPPPPQRPQIRSRSSEPPHTRALSPNPVPLLTPKPYFQPRPAAAETWNCKADGFLRVNGVADVPTKPESPGRESPPRFQASPSQTADSAPVAPPSAAGGNPDSTGQTESSPVEPSEEEKTSTEHLPPLSRPTSLPGELQKAEETFGTTAGHTEVAPQEEKPNPAARYSPPAEAKQKQEISEPSIEKPSSTVQSEVNAQHPLITSRGNVSVSVESPLRTASFGCVPLREKAADCEISVSSPQASSNPKSRSDFFAPPEDSEKDLCSHVSVPVLPLARRGDRWSWDPDEERKRQERWQQEQERMLQEKYRREQEKLKEEWEKAQREVVEEERKYHEEERRILEETVMPLTPRSSALSSPSRGEPTSLPEPQDTIVRSLADWERKQELLERQSRGGGSESTERKRRENDRTSDISTADDSMKTSRSLVSQGSSSKAENSLQNGQKLPPPPAPARKQHEPRVDGPRAANRPAGERRWEKRRFKSIQ
ncbi:LOW QUALITY PROTEIN: uncharacterized protein ACNS7B_012093 [Menidia menidia]